MSEESSGRRNLRMPNDDEVFAVVTQHNGGNHVTVRCQDGKERNAYRTIGAAWPDKDGGIGCIKLEVLPMQWDGTIYLRPRQELEEGDAQ